jgi:multidrug resistance efflux pump
VEDAQVQVSRAQFNTRQADLNTLKASVEAATIKMENAKLRFARTKNLAEQGAENKQQLENVQTEYASAQKEVERLQASLQTAQMQLQELQSQILLNQFQTSRKIIRAPQDGMVLSMDLSPGAAVQAMSSVAEFAPAGYTSVLAEIDELFADQITTGMKASIRKQGQLDTVASGQIIFTSPFLKKKSLFSEGGDLEDRRVREIRIRLDSTGLLFGSRVECIIQNNP